MFYDLSTHVCDVAHNKQPSKLAAAAASKQAAGRGQAGGEQQQADDRRAYSQQPLRESLLWLSSKRSLCSQNEHD